MVRTKKNIGKPKKRDPSWNKDYWGPVEKGKQLTILLQRHYYSKRAFREFLKTFQIKKKRIIKPAEQKRTVSSSKMVVGPKIRVRPESKVIPEQPITESIPKPITRRRSSAKVNGFGKSSSTAEIFSERPISKGERLAEKGKQAVWEGLGAKPISETKGQTKGKSISSSESFSKLSEKTEKIAEIDQSKRSGDERRSEKIVVDEKQKQNQVDISTTSSKESVSRRDIDEVPSLTSPEKSVQEKIILVEKPGAQTLEREFSLDKLPIPDEKPLEKEPTFLGELKTRESSILPPVYEEVRRKEDDVQPTPPKELAVPSEKIGPTEKPEISKPAEPARPLERMEPIEKSETPKPGESVAPSESVVEPPAAINRRPAGKITRDQDIRSHRDSTEKAINVMPDELFQLLSGRERSAEDRFGQREFETQFGHLGRRKIRELEPEPKPEKGERVAVLPTKPKNPSE